MNDCETMVELLTAAATVYAAWLAGIFTITAACGAVGAGVWGFFRQKEYELVQRRYLEEGLDIVIATAESALSTFHHSWARSLDVLKNYRDQYTNIKPIDIDQEVSRGFIALETHFALSANHRVRRLIRSNTAWEVFQLLISFARRGTTKVRDEIPQALKAHLAGEIGKPLHEFVGAVEDELKALMAEAHHFHHLITELEKIAAVLEGQRFSLKGAARFHGQSEVRDVINRLEETFAAELKEVRGRIDSL